MTQPENQIVSVVLPREIVAQIDETARNEKRTRSNMIALIIENHVNSQKA